MSDLLADFRYALRASRRSPLHAAATVLVLGVGVGAVTLMFSTLNASVLRPLPFPDPDRLVWGWKASDRIHRNSMSYEDIRDYAAGVDALEELGAIGVFRGQHLVTGLEEGERISSNTVSANFFAVLGVSPALGRTFLQEETVLGGAPVVILSDAYWRGRLGSDPAVIGRTLTLDGVPTEVVGVMPRGFEFRAEVQAWVPLREGDPSTLGRGNNNYFPVGRLREGITLEQAQVQVDVVARQIQEANPDFSAWFLWLQPLHEALFGNVRPVLLLLMGIVSLVPLVACANVASLTLARATTRGTELATRLALGAGRSRVVRQLLAESVLVALLGGVLGLALAFGGGALLRSLGPASIPRLDEIGVDPTVLVFALAVSLLTVPLFGVLPALRGTGLDLAQTLRSGGGRGGSPARSRSRSLLVVTQVALSMALLVASGLLFRSFLAVQSVDPGFESEGLLTAGIQLPSHRYADDRELALAWEQMLHRISALAGVEDVAAADWLPVSPGGGPWNTLSRPDRPLAAGDEGVPAARKFVTSGYFCALGIPLRAGRAFGDGDVPGGPGVIILSESLARALYPDEDPLGRPVTLWDQPFEVVGVSAAVAEEGLGVEARPTFFLSAAQIPQPALRLVLRTAGTDPLALTAALRAELKQLDPDIALTGIQTMEARIGATLAQPRFRTWLVGTFALVGLLLAAFGLYGVLAYLVTQRRQEIGIRMALGAEPGHVMGLVLREGLYMVGVGAALGLALGGGASVLLRRMLYGVGAADPLTLVGVTLLQGVVAAGASLIPARRAARVDPLIALRSE